MIPNQIRWSMISMVVMKIYHKWCKVLKNKEVVRIRANINKIVIVDQKNLRIIIIILYPSCYKTKMMTILMETRKVAPTIVKALKNNPIRQTL